MNQEILVTLEPTEIKDTDGIPDLMVKFQFSLVSAILEEGETVVINISGFFTNGNRFEGTDIIRVIN
ncbi:MAG: hypothetical protein ACFFDT_34740 [Candidatus Hodarchaeota archaeon]